MFAPVWQHVGCAPAAWRPARLHGFARYAVQGELYPGIVEQPHATVDGVLYIDVPVADLARLDAFEGCQYRRRTLRVQTLGEVGQWLSAEAFVYDDPVQLTGRAWSPMRFERDTIDEFLKTYGRRDGVAG